MCTVFFSVKTHPKYKLIILHNRDEFLIRPTKPLHTWNTTPEIFAGLDLQGQGTWFGINAIGRIALLTNVRKPPYIKDAPSRGALVKDWLESTDNKEDFLNRWREKIEQMNPFNFVFGHTDELYFISNKKLEPKLIPPGIWGLSNGDWDEPWPKVKTGKLQFAHFINPIDEKNLFALMQSKEKFSRDSLPKTGVDPELEYQLSSLFVDLPDYGTLSTTLLTIDNNNHVKMLELTRDQKNHEISTCF